MMNAFILCTGISYLYLLLTVRKANGEPPTYKQVAWRVEAQQWIKHDTYKISRRAFASDRAAIRYPHPEQLHQTTYVNQDLILLTDNSHDLLPKCQDLLRINKTPRRFFDFRDYAPFRFQTVNLRHRYAEHLGLRQRNFGSSDSMIIPLLYFPTGWPLFMVLVFLVAVFVVPLLGWFLVTVGFKVAGVFKIIIWSPIKLLLRAIVIHWERQNRRWNTFLAPPHYVEPRGSWKLPTFLRNDILEDTPPELAHKPPTNKIDYTMYILTQEDYDELDLGMDELEFVDEMLQFRDQYPKIVARLLKHRLGVDKFYYYFDEDVLSDEDDDEEEEERAKEKPKDTRESVIEQEEDEHLYLSVLDTDEPWMHEEFDETYTGFNLSEIRYRRQILQELREEIIYLHRKIQEGSRYDADMTDMSVEKKKRLQAQSKKLIERYLRYSNQTKERVKELEPSAKAQRKHNVALSKYLPLINQLSHYNHRLNLKHEKHRDPAKRKIQLEVFDWP